jgi:pimeloyl-ACP methyl ester carboxylesterase
MKNVQNGGSSDGGATLLSYRLDGSGEALLLLNGGLMSMVSWDRIVGQLSRSYQVLRCDLRGQLLSPGSPHPHLDGHVDDLICLLDSLDMGRAHVIGTSFGAEVGLLLAAQHSSRITSLVAATAADVFVGVDEFLAWSSPLRDASRIAAAGGDRMGFYDRLTERLYSRGYIEAHRDELDVRRRQVAALPDSWFAAADRLLATLETLDLRSYLPQISCPTLVLIAELDELVPPMRSMALAEGIRGSRVKFFKGSGHALVFEHPGQFAEICLDFLSSVEKQATQS